MKMNMSGLDCSGKPLPHSFLLIIDNRDSFVFNLVRYLAEMKVRVLVLEADALTVEDIRAMCPAGILLSPGPGHPSQTGLCLDVVRHLAEEYPVLGVCLGHQVIAHAFGARVCEGREPVHGRIHAMHHDGKGVFAGLPTPFWVTRYHSLEVESVPSDIDAPGLPDCLEVTARTEDGAVMGVRHKTLPVEGVQFHPEAEMTEHGHALLANFVKACGLPLSPFQFHPVGDSPEGDATISPHDEGDRMVKPVQPCGRQGFRILPVDCPVSPNQLMALFRKLSARVGTVFLDSAQRCDEMGEISLLAWSPWLSLRQRHGRVVRACHDLTGSCARQEPVKGDILTVLEAETMRLAKASETQALEKWFTGGAIGFLGYEAWDPISWLPAAQENGIPESPVSCAAKQPVAEMSCSDSPDAWFWFHRLTLVVDWKTGAAEWVVHNTEDALEQQHIQALIQEAVDLLAKGASTCSISVPATRRSALPENWQDRFASNFSRSTYIEAVEAMRQAIRRGDIYIANMTQQFSTTTDKSDLAVFEALRTRNPAVFSAFMSCGWEADRDARPLTGDCMKHEASEPMFSLISASPERFLQIRNGWIETRPIKGTRPRGRTDKQDEAYRRELEASEKDRAELLMITDLERNDLSRVCEPGTIHVRDLFSIDTLPTVHHLVATVRGRLASGNTAMDCLKACFPGGSITGAPKISAMEVIRTLERTPRGPYTGALGWLDVTGNAAFSIIIRTLVKQDRNVRFGVGGGITWESNPDAEYEETLHKASALMHAIDV